MTFRDFLAPVYPRRNLLNVWKTRLRRASTFAAALCVAWFVSASAFAGETEDLNFAKKLRRDGMYVAAAEEFLRFGDKYPQSPLRAEALFSAGESYLQAAKANEALGAYEKFLEAYPKDERACLAHLQRGKVLKALKRYKEGADELLQIAEENPACPVVDQALLDGADCLMSMGDSDGASKVLRRLIADRKDSALAPRARYTLALALMNTGRDMEAEQVLGDIVTIYPSSPVRALALIMIGNRALAKNDYSKAEQSYRLVEKDFKEDPLAEKAVLGIIDVESKKGNPEGVLNESERFLERFPKSESTATVTRRAIEAALRLRMPGRALELVSSLRAGTASPDSTGEVALLAARVLAENEKTNEAIGELRNMRNAHPRSPYLKDALVLEAELREKSGASLEAARLYNLALMEDIDRTQRLALNARLAELASSRLADTLSALRYWGLVADEDSDGAAAEEAIFKASLLREQMGDLGGAARGYESIVSRFPGGKYVEQARARLGDIAERPVWNASVARELARIAASPAGQPQRSIETGSALVELARDPEAAIPYLEEALAKELPDSLRARGMYYLGAARLMRYHAARGRGEDAGAERAKGFDLLQQASQKYAGTRWGERAHRKYLENRFEEWDASERLSKLDDYLNLYGRGEGRSWGLAAKAAILYERATAGDTAASRAALALANDVAGSGAPPADKREAVYLGAYLKRMRGDYRGAAKAFEEFAGAYPGDPRVTSVLFDLGETLVWLQDYVGASAAYDRCIARAPGRALAEKCRLRKGDCLFSQGHFAEAAEAYAACAAAFPESDLAPEAVYREATAQDKLGESLKAEETLRGLLAREGLPRAARLKALSWLGARYLDRRQFEASRPLLEELAQGERTATNMNMAAEAELGAGDYAAAVKSFSDALGLPGVDTCRALAGRTRSYLRLKEADRYAVDAASLAARCAAWNGLGSIMLEQGKMEAEEGRCEEAAKTLGELQKRFPGTDEGNEAFLYLGLCDLKRGGYKEGAEKIESFIGSSPSSPMLPQAYFKLASAQYGAGNLNLAAKNYALAAESTKDRELAFAAWKNLGSVYQQMEKWDEAAATWQKLAETFPEREGIVEVLFDLGLCYNQMGKNELAYDVYSRIPNVATTEEQQGRAHYWAGMTLKSMGKYDEAIGELLRVSYLKTGGMWGVTAKLEAAGCYELKGDLGQAQAIYENVLSGYGASSDWGHVASEGIKRIEETKAQKGAGTRLQGDSGKKE
jgi:TolA-binding protein